MCMRAAVQISVLDGNLYDQKFLDNGKQYDGGMEPVEELDACALLQNKKKVGVRAVSSGP